MRQQVTSDRRHRFVLHPMLHSYPLICMTIRSNHWIHKRDLQTKRTIVSATCLHAEYGCNRSQTSQDPRGHHIQAYGALI